MYVSTVVTIGTDHDGRFERELVVQRKFTATVDVRQVQWSYSVYNVGTDEQKVYTHLIAIGRWRKRDGEWSVADARSPIREDQLPPYCAIALRKAKAGVE